MRGYALLGLLFVLPAFTARAGPLMPADLLPVTPQLLERWDIGLERYELMTADERRVLLEDLTLRELTRLKQLELLQLAVGERWPDYVTEDGLLTAEGLRLAADHQAQAFLKTKTFSASKLDLRAADVPKPDAEDFTRARLMLARTFDGAMLEKTGKPFASGFLWDARVRNETLYSLSATDPRSRLTFEVGQLGVGVKSSLIAPSWYVNMTRAWESPVDSRRMDVFTEAQAAYIPQFASRFFDDPVPVPGLNRVLQLGSSLGVPPEQLAAGRGYIEYKDPYKKQELVVASVRTHVGRAYNALAAPIPIDVSWVIGNLSKVAFLAPNTAFDETVGVRTRFGPKDKRGSLGLFAGAAQNLSPITNRVLQNALSGAAVKPATTVEIAPHATVALWGKAPVKRDIGYSLSGSERWNKDTKVFEAEGSLTSKVFKRDLALRGIHSREAGPEIEYQREKLRGQVDFQFLPKARAYVAYESDRIQYGNAKLSSKSALTGVDVALGANLNVSVDHRFGGRYLAESPLRDYIAKNMGQLNLDIINTLEASQNAGLVAGGLNAGGSQAQVAPNVSALSLALGQLSPPMAAALADRLAARGLSDPQKGALAFLLLSQAPAANQQAVGGTLPAPSAAPGTSYPWNDPDYFKNHKQDLAELAGLLADEQVWEAVVIDAGRGAILAQMDKLGSFTIPVLNMPLSVGAPVMVAAGSMFSNWLSPLAPIRQKDIVPGMLRAAATGLGMDPSQASPDAIASRILELGNQQIQSNLAHRVETQLDELISGGYDQQAVADRILTDLPSGLSQSLQQRYGSNLAGLLPPTGTDPALVKSLILSQIQGNMDLFLQSDAGAQIAKHLAQSISVLGDFICLQANMTLIQMMLASEDAFNRLTVDHGMKIDALNVRRSMAQFDNLDKRGRLLGLRRLEAARKALTKETEREQERLNEKFKNYGRTVLESLVRGRDWPRGLRIEVPEKSWAGLLTAYGDVELFGMLRRVAVKFGGERHPGKRAVSITYDPVGAGVSMLTTKGSPDVRFVVGRPRDRWEANDRIKWIEDYLSD